VLDKDKYIKSLIMAGESQVLDFKYNISDSRKIAKTLSAFANTDGGKLLIGVRDNGSIAGIRSDEEIFMLEAASEVFTKPVIKLDIHEWQVDNKMVLEVDIIKSNTKPHFAQNDDDKWLAYIRHKDNNILANKILIKLWKREHEKKGTLVKYRKKEELLLKYLKEHDNITLSQVQKLLKLPRYIAENILVNLISIEVLKINIGEESFSYSLK
jgi:predicted HTH transcriptional regulator